MSTLAGAGFCKVSCSELEDKSRRNKPQGWTLAESYSRHPPTKAGQPTTIAPLESSLRERLSQHFYDPSTPLNLVAGTGSLAELAPTVPYLGSSDRGGCGAQPSVSEPPPASVQLALKTLSFPKVGSVSNVGSSGVSSKLFLPPTKGHKPL